MRRTIATRRSTIFILDAVIELALLDSATSAENPQHAFFARASALRELLKFEFYFPRRADFRREVEECFSQRFENWEEALRQGESGVNDLLKASSPLVAHAVLRSFIDAYRIVAGVLVTKEDDAIDDEAGIISECLKAGKQQLLQGRVFSAESVSKTLYATGMKLANYRGLLAENQAEARRELLQELRRITAHLDKILSLTLAAWDDE